MAGSQGPFSAAVSTDSDASSKSGMSPSVVARLRLLSQSDEIREASPVLSQEPHEPPPAGALPYTKRLMNLHRDLFGPNFDGETFTATTVTIQDGTGPASLRLIFPQTGRRAMGLPSLEMAAKRDLLDVKGLQDASLLNVPITYPRLNISRGASPGNSPYESSPGHPGSSTSQAQHIKAWLGESGFDGLETTDEQEAIAPSQALAAHTPDLKSRAVGGPPEGRQPSPAAKPGGVKRAIPESSEGNEQSKRPKPSGQERREDGALYVDGLLFTTLQLDRASGTVTKQYRLAAHAPSPRLPARTDSMIINESQKPLQDFPQGNNRREVSRVNPMLDGYPVIGQISGDGRLQFVGRLQFIEDLPMKGQRRDELGQLRFDAREMPKPGRVANMAVDMRVKPETAEQTYGVAGAEPAEFLFSPGRPLIPFVHLAVLRTMPMAYSSHLPLALERYGELGAGPAAHPSQVSPAFGTLEGQRAGPAAYPSQPPPLSGTLGGPGAGSMGYPSQQPPYGAGGGRDVSPTGPPPAPPLGRGGQQQPPGLSGVLTRARAREQERERAQANPATQSLPYRGAEGRQMQGRQGGKRR